MPSFSIRYLCKGLDHPLLAQIRRGKYALQIVCPAFHYSSVFFTTPIIDTALGRPLNNRFENNCLISKEMKVYCIGIEIHIGKKLLVKGGGVTKLALETR